LAVQPGVGLWRRWWLVTGEIVVAIVLYGIMRYELANARWPSIE
jgi:hypothetical protein